MASQNTEQKNNLMVQMEYYQYNVCASCHPEDDFFAVVSDTISPIKQKYPYEIAVYNTFRAEDKKRFEKRLQELGLKEADVSLPTLIMISEDSEALVCLSGLDEIKEKLEDTLKQAAQPEQFVSKEAALESDEKTEIVTQAENENQIEKPLSNTDWKNQLREAVSKDKSTDSVILYFSTISCTDCSEVKSLLKKMTDEQTTNIIYIAALAGVSPELQEAAIVDGANRFQRIIHVDLPAIVPTIITMLIFNCASIMNIGFDKVYLMQNDMNIDRAEVISTFVYKVGLTRGDFSFSTAAGLFQSLVSFILLVIVNKICKTVTETSLW